MEPQSIGGFIAALRKERHLTQRQLAEVLHITDKAVSKWERGLSCPDITLLHALAEQLGVTVGELLEGKRSDPPAPDAEELVSRAIDYAEQSVRVRRHSLRQICAWGFSGLLLAGIVTCIICNLAIAGAITWARYPITACIFAWLISFPALYFGSKGIPFTLGSLSLFILPFLYALECFTGVQLMGMGIPISIVSMGYLWAGYGIWKRVRRRWLGVGWFLLLGIPVSLLINLAVAVCIHVPFLELWDWVTMAVLAAGGGICIWRDMRGRDRS